MAGFRATAKTRRTTNGPNEARRMTTTIDQPGPIDSGPMAPGYGTAYYNLVADHRPRWGLEIGTETGLSAANWLLASPYGVLTSVDVAPCPEARTRIAELGETVE